MPCWLSFGCVSAVCSFLPISLKWDFLYWFWFTPVKTLVEKQLTNQHSNMRSFHSRRVYWALKKICRLNIFCLCLERNTKIALQKFWLEMNEANSNWVVSQSEIVEWTSWKNAKNRDFCFLECVCWLSCETRYTARWCKRFM